MADCVQNTLYCGMTDGPTLFLGVEGDTHAEHAFALHGSPDPAFHQHSILFVTVREIGKTMCGIRQPIRGNGNSSSRVPPERGTKQKARPPPSAVDEAHLVLQR